MSRKNFAKFVLTDEKLKKLMQSQDYEKFISLKRNMGAMDFCLASKIAMAIKKWALSLGATHYTHWFFPLTSRPAEKQVSFLDRSSTGKVIKKFDANSLIRGETDASSFPSGNERMTFEARGYTVWDYSSPVFIKQDGAGNKVLYIPTAFCSYNGVALDDKTPLLRAAEKLNVQLKEFLGYMGMPVSKVVCNLGSEQEYFLIDADIYKKRKDLVLTGRTLFSSPPLKTQEANHHYFCSISPKISEFMHELDEELWELGILAKIQHNEVAPCQFEIVPLYANANISADQNMLTMEVMEKIAERHNLKVLFHEKPFSFINGSGKHNNWSISTDTGINLLDRENVSLDIFMAVFTSVLAATGRHYDLLRMSCATLSNDLRLGGDAKEFLDTKTSSAFKIFKDDCDRNRTSPFAFTGNKFEFRMVGSAQNTALCNAILCMIVAERFEEINKILKTSPNRAADIKKIVRENLQEASKIIFNGNSYDSEWQNEAAKRGLKTFSDSISCYERLLQEENLSLFERSGVMTRAEVSVHFDTLVNSYTESALLEAKTLASMVETQICPTLLRFECELLKLSGLQENFGLDSGVTKSEVQKIHGAATSLKQEVLKLQQKFVELESIQEKLEKAIFVRDQILPFNSSIRKIYDDVEKFLLKNLSLFQTMTTFYFPKNTKNTKKLFFYL